MKVTIHIPGKSALILETESVEKVKMLKVKIQEKENIPIARQRLLFKGKELDDNRSLESYIIVDGDILRLIVHAIQTFPIFIKTAAGNVFSLDVEPSETIGSIKTRIEDSQGFIVPSQRITFEGKELANKRTLISYLIRRNDTLQLSILQITTIELNFKTSSGKHIFLTIEPSDLVSSVKEKLALREGIPIGKQRLIFGKEELDDDRSINSYVIHDRDTLLLIVREID